MMWAQLSTCTGMLHMMDLVTAKMLVRRMDMLMLWMMTKTSDSEEQMVVVQVQVMSQLGFPFYPHAD